MAKAAANSTRTIIGKDALVTAIAGGLPADMKLTKVEVAAVVEGALASIKTALVNGEEVRLTGVGTLRTKLAGERQSRNPRTGEKVVVPARRAVKFSVASDLKDAVAAV